METPDITPIQIRAALLWVFSFLALVGVNVSTSISNQVMALSLGFASALPVILVYADALIRRARAENLQGILASRDPNTPGVPVAPSYIEGEGGG